jgi:hypothetical protein
MCRNLLFSISLAHRRGALCCEHRPLRDGLLLAIWEVILRQCRPHSQLHVSWQGLGKVIDPLAHRLLI